MIKLEIRSFAVAFGLGLALDGFAQGMSSADHRTVSDRIAGDYKSATTDCRSLPGNLRAVCLVEAKGGRDVSRAELAARFKPTDANRERVAAVRADARYAVAKEHCSGMNDVTKRSCLKEARAIELLGKTNDKP